MAGARPGAGPGGQGAGRAAGPRFKWTAMVADIGRHRLWHGRAALQRAGGAAAAGQRPAGRKSSRPSGRPGGWPGPAKRPAARPAARPSPLCGMRGQLEIGLTGVIFAHFFCGGRVRSTFPAAPLPSAACPGSHHGPRPVKATTYQPPVPSCASRGCALYLHLLALAGSGPGRANLTMRGRAPSHTGHVPAIGGQGRRLPALIQAI